MKTGEDVFIGNNVNIIRKELVEIGDHVAIDYGFPVTIQPAAIILLKPFKVKLPPLPPIQVT